MKTKNNLTTGILLGIGVIILPLILMGTTYTTEKQNKFEVHMVEKLDGLQALQGYLLNSETGDIWHLKGGKKTECK